MLPPRGPLEKCLPGKCQAAAMQPSSDRQEQAMPPSLLALLPSPRLNWVPSTSAQPWQCLGAAGSADHPPQAGNRQQSPGFPEPSTGVFHGIRTDPSLLLHCGSYLGFDAPGKPHQPAHRSPTRTQRFWLLSAWDQDDTSTVFFWVTIVTCYIKHFEDKQSFFCNSQAPSHFSHNQPLVLLPAGWWILEKTLKNVAFLPPHTATGTRRVFARPLQFGAILFV